MGIQLPDRRQWPSPRRRPVEFSDMTPCLLHWTRDGTAEKASDMSDVTADVPAHFTGDMLGVPAAVTELSLDSFYLLWESVEPTD